MGQLDGKIAIITGASRGIGKAIAIRLASEGASVVLAAKTVDPNPRLPGTLEDVRKEIVDLGGKAFVQATDVREDDRVLAVRPDSHPSKSRNSQAPMFQRRSTRRGRWL